MASEVVLSRAEKRPFFLVRGGLPDEVVERVDEELSFFVKGYRNDEDYKAGRWDGREHLLQRTSGGTYYFPVGLLPIVTGVLRSSGVRASVRGRPRKGERVLDLGWRKYSLRPYQREAVNAILGRGFGTISLPTGTGKTLIGLYVMYRLGRPAMVTVHRKEVADQWVNRIRRVLGTEAARYYGGRKENGDLQVALYQSIYRDGEVSGDVRLDHDLFIADEVHRVAADTYFNVAMATGAQWRVGLSATPFREDGSDLRMWAGTGPVILEYPPEYMVERGYLARPVFKIFDTRQVGAGYDSWREEYRNEIVENPYRNGKIAEAASEFASEGRTVYIHVERLDHGRRLEDLIPNARFVHGRSGDREELVEAFRRGRQRILISTLLGEGFDAPVNAFINAAGFKSEVMTIQRIGRALRPGRVGNALIVDFRDEGKYVGEHYRHRLRTYRGYYGKYFSPSLVGLLKV